MISPFFFPTPVCLEYDQYIRGASLTALPIDLDIVKLYLKIDGNLEDALLTFIINVVTRFIEKYIGRILINTSFTTYRNSFEDAYCCGFTLKRSKFVSLDLYTYVNTDNVVTPVDSSLFYVTDSNDYSTILLNPSKTYPADILCRRQAIKIEFTAGYGIDDTFIPADIQEAILQIVADMYMNRGDCTNIGKGSCACAKLMSSVSKGILDQYRILSI